MLCSNRTLSLTPLLSPHTGPTQRDTPHTGPTSSSIRLRGLSRRPRPVSVWNEQTLMICSGNGRTIYHVERDRLYGTILHIIYGTMQTITHISRFDYRFIPFLSTIWLTLMMMVWLATSSSSSSSSSCAANTGGCCAAPPKSTRHPQPNGAPPVTHSSLSYSLTLLLSLSFVLSGNAYSPDVLPDRLLVIISRRRCLHDWYAAPSWRYGCREHPSKHCGVWLYWTHRMDWY